MDEVEFPSSEVPVLELLSTRRLIPVSPGLIRACDGYADMAVTYEFLSGLSFRNGRLPIMITDEQIAIHTGQRLSSTEGALRGLLKMGALRRVRKNVLEVNGEFWSHDERDI